MSTNNVDRDRRCGDAPIPDNLKDILNKAQWQALPGIEYSESGWKLQFLRRPLFQEPVPVLHNSNDGRIGILGTDGSIKIQPVIKVRE